ncbi:unnamed protein product [Sphagnum balticum]
MDKGVQRWAVNVFLWTPSPHQFRSCLSLLPPCERSSVLRFVNFEDQKRALLSRLLQRKLVQFVLGLNYDCIVIERTPEGKPYLNKNLNLLSNFNFNVSHHGDYVVIVSEPMCLVGVDVMAHDTRSKDPPHKFFEVFSACFTPCEWETILSAGPEEDMLFHQFYRFWCMKEAYIKAVGIGLGFELQRAEFHYQDGNIWSNVAHVRIDAVHKAKWQFFLHSLDDKHWVCVAKGPPADAIGSLIETPSGKPIDGDTCDAALTLQNKSFILLTVEQILSTEKLAI